MLDLPVVHFAGGEVQKTVEMAFLKPNASREYWYEAKEVMHDGS